MKKPGTELIRGAGTTAVLSLLEEREMYGWELSEALAEETGGLLELGRSTLYPMLYNLEAKDLVESRWGSSDTGRRRKYYGLTEKGRRHLERRRGEWASLVLALERVGVLGAPGSGS